MSNFSERLDGLMFENNLNAKTLAEQLNTSPTCISHYLQAKRLPTVKSLVVIADFFQCSTDFLLGFEEYNPNLTFKSCPPFCERLKFLKTNFDFTAYKIYSGTNVAKSCYYNWISGQRIPSVDNIIKLAEIFDCRIDYILGRES